MPYGANADGIKAATVAVLNTFCTPGSGAPYCNKAAEVTLNAELLGRIQKTTELLDTDAAADEILAGQKLQGKRQRRQGADETVFPNIKIQNRDKPHASRRIVSRTWQSDGYLHAVCQTFVHAKSSISRIIANSSHFKDIFEKNCKLMAENPTTTASIRDISSKMHRWESSSKPFGRGVLYFDALVSTAQRIIDERGKHTVEGQGALHFLEFCDPEVLMQFAMLADAGDENLALVRFMDDEKFDKSELAGELQAFLRNIDWHAPPGPDPHPLQYKIARRSIAVWLEPHSFRAEMHACSAQ